MITMEKLTIHIHTYTHAHTHTHTHTYIYIYIYIYVCVCVCMWKIYTLNSDRTLRATAGAKIRKVVAVFQRVTVRILALKRTET